MRFLQLNLIALFIFIQLPAFSFTILPYSKSFTTKPGSSETTVIKYSSDLNAPYEVNVYVMDVGLDKNGKKIFKKPGGFNYSLAKYIKVSPNRFTTTDKNFHEVKVSIDVPKDMVGGHQALVFFDSFPLASKLNKSKHKIIFKAKVAALILHETPGTINVKTRIKSLDIITPTGKKPLKLKMSVLNEGNSHVYGSATIALLDEKERFISNFNIEKTLVLPNSTGDLVAEWKGYLKEGTYHALITYQYSDDKSITVDKVFKILKN